MTLNLPKEFEAYMKSRLGTEYDQFRGILDTLPPVSVRYNPLKSKGDRHDPVPWCSYGSYLEQRPVFTLDPKFHAGAYYVQEASSMFLEQAVVQTTDIGNPAVVLDLCAAPGGKSTHLLSLLSGESLLVSNETIKGRTASLKENLQKWGNSNVIVTHNDPADFKKLPAFFDIILVDAPCSGEGLFRKEPEAATHWSMKNVELCTLRQRRILEDIIPALKPGGLLIFSTCTYNEKENESNIKWLAASGEFDPVALTVDQTWNIHRVDCGSAHGYQLYPHAVRGEGFFVSALRKKEGASIRVKVKDTLRYPSPNHRQGLASWLARPEEQTIFMHGTTARFFPASRKDEFLRILNTMNVIAAGTALAEIVRDKFIPEHGLAVSGALCKPAFHTLRLDKDQAIRYLRRENISAGTTPPGFTLIEYDGLGLGWVNVLSNRVNNLYPSEYRIRMGP